MYTLQDQTGESGEIDGAVITAGEFFQMAKEKSNEYHKNLSRKTSDTMEPDELADDINYDKMKVECICPKCGNRHMMNFHWIGRGTPRKFCPPCKGSSE